MAKIHTWYEGNRTTVTQTLDASGVTVVCTLLNSADTTIWTGSLTEGATASGTTTYSATVDTGDLLSALTVGQRLKMKTVGTLSGVAVFKNMEAVMVEERGGNDG